ncbi:ribosome biogenesis GTPase YlqF [Acutalibacter intestini]|uniref:ribosome biogenesis GTPase YlqF n=1 Tax=Acutalibacter intestini TaxID=3093659 RepID=UPI002AC9A65C|nr:ribosome biogenesis GTPase YlqF [Acutalibacter sp. M00204]
MPRQWVRILGAAELAALFVFSFYNLKYSRKYKDGYVMSEVQSIQWFPGHMAKTRRKITEDLKLVDIVIELLDARVPKSSSNPVLRDIIRNKPRVVVLNKADLADQSQTVRWVAKCKDEGLRAIPVESKTGKGLPALFSSVREELKEQIAKWTQKGMIGRPIRIMVLGVPNVGKSSIINRMLLGGGAGKAEVRDKPGVTRQNRWFTVGKGFEILDTPGVLWPKFEDPVVGEHLAFTGAVRDEILDIEGLTGRLLELLMELYPQAVSARYKFDLPKATQPGHVLLEMIGKKRGMLVSGGEIDTERAAITVLDEYRGGKMGPMTLEWP